MANERRSQYKGCAITTRWAESRLPEELMQKRFTASFSVSSPDAHDSAWQQFPEEQFETPASASSHALEVAKRAIDQRITRRPFPKPAWPR